LSQPKPLVRSVLAVTDLSPFGNAAIPHAYAITPNGGVVHLFHVIEREPVPSPLYAHYSPGRHASPQEREAGLARCRADLAKLEPADARARGVRTEVDVIEAEDVAPAILRAAQGARADVICIATHGRTGMLGALVGSVAKAVIEDAKQPLLLIPSR
jgi:nucleotide-binding universal stress UspA family protein